MSTTTTKLERHLWKSYFDRVSKSLDGKRIEIEVASPELGSQVAAEWLPVLGVTFDEKDNLLAVIAEGLDHMVRQPRDVFVQAEGTELQTIHIVGGDGISHLVRFRQPLTLGAP